MSTEHRMIERAARAGYLTKGVLYILLGALSVQAAWEGGRAAGSKEAAQTAASQPFGTVLVALIAAGLVGYAIWNVLQALYDTENKGTDWKGVVKRLGFGVSAAIHLGLAWTCARLAMGNGERGERQVWLDRVLASDFGPVLLGTTGAAVIGFGASQLYVAYSEKYCEPLNLSAANHNERQVIDVSGKVGSYARGVVFVIVGYALLRGAFGGSVRLDGGIKAALEEISRSPAGPIGLSVVSMGLLLYGAFLVAAARYRRVTSERVRHG